MVSDIIAAGFLLIPVILIINLIKGSVIIDIKIAIKKGDMMKASFINKNTPIKTPADIKTGRPSFFILVNIALFIIVLPIIRFTHHN